MKRYLTKLGLIALLAVMLPCNAAAQPSDKNLYSFDYIKNSNGWLTSYNAAGLCVLPVQSISIAEAYANKSNGDFINYYQSNNSYNIGAQTESFLRIGEKVFTYGKLSYDNFRGENMGGSVFIDPYFSSFNIVEMSDTTYGRKSKEMYHLVGGVGYDFGKGFRIGGKVDYTTGNYAKAKDLRHTNFLLDMIVTAGVSYQIGNVLDIGVNYLYRRNIESLDFEIYGTTDKFYYTLIDFGAFYGQREQSGERGYSNQSDKMPSVSIFNGASLQLDFTLSQKAHWFNEFSYRARNGYYGKKSENSITYIEDNGMELDYSGLLSLDSKSSLHTVKLSASYKHLVNNENIYQENSVGGRTTISYFGSNEVLDRTTVNGNIEYTANLGVNSYMPKWIIKAGADGFYRYLTTSIYPFYRKQNVLSVNTYLTGHYNIIKDKDIYGFTLGAGYGFGGGTMFEDGTYVAVTNQKVPRTAEYALQREYEYLTANRLNASAALRYSRFFNKGITGYAELNYKFKDGLNLMYLKGNTYHSVTLTLGLSF
ncbi:MAG: DUF6850 family outer membrane beta-barrel protein [Bacteroidales bacterium]